MKKKLESLCTVVWRGLLASFIFWASRKSQIPFRICAAFARMHKGKLGSPHPVVLICGSTDDFQALTQSRARCFVLSTPYHKNDQKRAPLQHPLTLLEPMYGRYHIQIHPCGGFSLKDAIGTGIRNKASFLLANVQSAYTDASECQCGNGGEAMNLQGTPPTEGLVAVVWHDLFASSFFCAWRIQIGVHMLPE
jgi:hypothetical protein